jgi:hypothetical protein
MTQNPSVNVNWVPGITLEEMEKHCILAAIRFYRGNKTQTAGALGIAIRTLDAKLEKYEADTLREDEKRVLDRIERAATLDRMRGVEFTRQNTVGSAFQSQPAERNRQAEQKAASVLNAPSGMGVESSARATTEHVVPLPERKEVQSVLPRQAGQNRKHGHR